jgi:F0F1-type ATP synthase assembly protein I
MEQNRQQKKDNDRVDYYRWAGFGFEFCGVIGIFCYIGYKADEYLKTSPLLLLAGFFAGFAGMTYITIKDLSKRNDNNRKRQ